MATNHASGSGDTRPPATSPRAPKGRENARNIPCRNLAIYGYCRYEKDGCMYNHDMQKQNSSQAQADSAKKRFNVDSPSFTPGTTDRNGMQPSPSASSPAPKAISPKSANAAAFTPRSINPSFETPPPMPQQSSSEWSNHEIPEFVPQGFNPTSMGDGQVPNVMPDAFNPYAGSSSYASLDATPPNQSINPYGPEASASQGQAFFQQPATFTQPLQHHLYAPIGPYRDHLLPYQRTAHDFFISENIRQELQRKSDATLQILPNSNLPPNIDHFHSLVPLDTNNQRNTTSFTYNSWVYKAISSQDGHAYVLRRLEGYRLTNEKAIKPIQAWKRISNGSVVSVHDCFTTRAFGDSSLVFVTDYHPLAKTLAEHHYTHNPSNYHKSRAPNAVLIPEQILWGYIIQLASALKAIHAGDLAARLLTPTKVLVTGKNRIRINACGILDVVHANEQSSLQQLQQGDMQQLGRLILGLANNSQNTSSHTKAMENLSRNYSTRFRDCVVMLIEQPMDIDSLLSSVADKAFMLFDNSLHLEDELSSDLNRELENGRLVRLLTKLGLINERPEYNEHAHGQNQWSETGERYYLKLFRDYVFHQVSPEGKPVVDLGHVLTCLNKLDAGSEEKIALVTRDEQNVLVVSYKDIKRGLESAFQDLVKAQRRA